LDIDAGSLVYSIAGRDKGGVFVIMRLEGIYGYLADGKVRKADVPKKKKLKHVEYTGYTASALQDKIALGERPTNAEIRRAIAAYHEENNQSS